ncbi:MAG: adenylosuccinate synthase, partial [bacterium]
KKEIDSIKSLGLTFNNKLYISKKAHLILPTHRILDKASEEAKGITKIGSTLKGIGPTYMDKTGRNGIRVGDILSPNFKEKYHGLTKKHQDILKQYPLKYKIEEYEEGWMEGIETIKSFTLIDNEYLLHDYLQENKSILAEGAQGTLLDIDFGSYPFVTSSNTICAGACVGLGLAPNRIGDVFGIFKAYCTRVGSGPFPTELHDSTGEELRNNGHEFGSTTGRPRRCGWLDLPALKYAVIINGVTQLIMTKVDVFTGMKKIRVCTGYKINGEVTERFPNDPSIIKEPVYKDFDGWEGDISNTKIYDELPGKLLDYIKFIENEIHVPISIISVGPDRNETIIKK